MDEILQRLEILERAFVLLHPENGEWALRQGRRDYNDAHAAPVPVPAPAPAPVVADVPDAPAVPEVAPEVTTENPVQ